MNWTYQNEEITGISDFPNETFGFIYRVIHIPSGKAYIGKKVLQHTRKVKLTKKELAEYEGVVGRRPSYRLAVKESDWQTYWGSNKYLKELMKEEPLDNFERQIIACAPTKKLLTYYEVKYQMIYQVLEKPDEFFNDNILGKFFTKDFD
ncbi:MAG: hypothetical protein HKN40_05915 [Winogradskyella sp.]|uniref:hypothetical protein n=1 Tax=Winogradskyella sp. TaxID=1883156 RepID=UPI00185382C0|nr:hypothetical protein [Winogradskyella sp.]